MIMYRSASWNRVSDEYGSVQSSSMRMPSSSFDDGDQQLPLYDQNIIAEMAKKERARVKFAENAVHLIPLVLILCALILWLFSTTPARTGEGIKAESVAARIEGEIDNDSDGTQIGIIDLKDHLDSQRLTQHHKSSSKME